MKRSKTPTFLLELPLRVDSQQAKHEAQRILKRLAASTMRFLGKR